MNMPISYFFENCCKDNPNFSFKANINFASDYPRRSFVVKNILDYFYPQYKQACEAESLCLRIKVSHL
jgi:hypothetical protein